MWRSCKVSKSSILIILVIVPYFLPKYLDYPQNAFQFIQGKVITFWYILNTLLLVLIMSKMNKHFWFMYKPTIYILGWRLCLLISTILGEHTFRIYEIWLKQTFFQVGGVLAINVFVNYNPNALLKSLYNWFYLLNSLNLVIMIFMPAGIKTMKQIGVDGSVWQDRIHFLDIDNRIILWVILTYYISFVFVKIYNNKKVKQKNAILYLILFLQVILAKSATGMIGFTIIAFYYVFSKGYIKHFFLKLVNFTFLLLSFGILWLGIVSGIIINYFTFFIEGILNKNINLSGRIYIWESAKKMILQEWIVGYGIAKNGVYFVNGNMLWYAHNQIFDIMIQAGALGLFCFLYIIIKTDRISRTCRITYKHFLICLFAYLVVGVTEHFLLPTNNAFWCFLTIAYCYSYKYHFTND